MLVLKDLKDAEKVTPHSLWHHFAVFFLQHGGDSRSLQKILRHSDLTTTAIYLDYTEDAVAQAYDRVFEPPEKARAVARAISPSQRWRGWESYWRTRVFWVRAPFPLFHSFISLSTPYLV